ncbi:hypothetical protein JHK87_016255 [Glycine soja]|nr:hypothetical protein JHK87_016255 [Glycine soja]
MHSEAEALEHTKKRDTGHQSVPLENKTGDSTVLKIGDSAKVMIKQDMKGRKHKYGFNNNKREKTEKKRVVDDETGDKHELYEVISGHLGWVRSIAVDPSNISWFFGSSCSFGQLWDLASGVLKLTLIVHIEQVRGKMLRIPKLLRVLMTLPSRCGTLDMQLFTKPHSQSKPRSTLNIMISDPLKVVAEGNNIDGLYQEIQQDPRVLESIDSIPFVETPLHVAASLGHFEFAIKIITLKPSLAVKLNPEGFTPIHLALQCDHDEMVLRLVEMSKYLV